MSRIYEPALFRFPRYYRELDSGCWEWTGTKTRKGYGMFRFDGRMWQAHRYAYERFVGPIPDGLQIDHLCRNRACVNPAHLEVVTPSENRRRGKNGVLKETCRSGRHPWVEENMHHYMGPEGPRRECKFCREDREARRDRNGRRLTHA